MLVLSGPAGDLRTCDQDRVSVELPANRVALFALKRRRHRVVTFSLTAQTQIELLSGLSAKGASLLLRYSKEPSTSHDCCSSLANAREGRSQSPQGA